jgi:P4 family phage/plasmid primase-like protien
VSGLYVPEVTPEDDTLGAALKYARAGWYVGYTQPGTKMPGMGTKWQHKTSRDTEEIVAWFSGTNAGIFLHAGRSGAVIVDIDHREKFPEHLLPLLDGAPHQTTRIEDHDRGHYLFGMPPGRLLGNAVGNLGQGWGEIRGLNGYIVVAPSVHPETDGLYQWQKTGDVPVMPDAIHTLLPDGQRSDDIADDATITAFLAQHTEASRPTLLKAVLTQFTTKCEAGHSRHEELLRASVWGMREAASGLYTAQSVWDGLWTDFEAMMRDTPNRYPRAEFRRVMAWAISQAMGTDVVARRVEVQSRLEAADPLPAVAPPTTTVNVHSPDQAVAVWVPPRDSRDYIDPKDGLDAALLADDVLHMGQLAWGRDESFWSYNDGVWRRDKDAVERRCVLLLAGRFRGAHASNVATIVRHRIGDITCDPVVDYINFTNGMLDWRTGELLPHAPHYGSTVQLPVAWDPDATAPVFDQFLRSVLSDDYAELAWEMIGYLMMNGNPLQVAFLMLGEGQNGKGTIIRVLQNLLGRENTSAQSLDSLSTNRFSPANLFGMLANLAGDIDATYLEKTAAFKKLTGEDEFDGEHKYGAAFNFVNWAVPVFSANKVPGSADTSGGYLRRWKLIEFNRVITDEERIPGLSSALSDELPGIAATAWGYLQKVMGRNGGKGALKADGDIAHGAERFAEEIDQIRQFADQCLMPAPDQRTDQPAIYAAYKWWAGNNGMGILKSPEVSARLTAIGFPLKKSRGKRSHAGCIIVEAPDKAAITVPVEDFFQDNVS